MNIGVTQVSTELARDVPALTVLQRLLGKSSVLTEMQSCVLGHGISDYADEIILQIPVKVINDIFLVFSCVNASSARLESVNYVKND
jgi:hypothetical protein